MTKVKNAIEKSDFQKKYFSLLLFIMGDLIINVKQKRMKFIVYYSEGLQVLVAEQISILHPG